MKKVAIIFLLFLIVSINLLSQTGRFMKYPDIYKDKIVFSYEGDLWSVNAAGGNAVRLTSAPGIETMPRISPDGESVAFTGSYDGGSNVYSMNIAGGEPFRLSYNPGGGSSMGWTVDGSRVIMRSYFENFIMRDPNLFFLDKNGGAPERFPLERGTMCSFDKSGKKMLYVRKGNEEYNWKRYKGGQYCDIWMYDFESSKFTPVTNYVGKNAYPMWIGNAMYFVSDRGDGGVSNLYKQDLTSGEITQITKFTDVDVMMPETDGLSIVFMHDGYINVLDIATNNTTKLDIKIASDKWALRSKTINPKDYIHYVEVSNSGKKVAIEARGDVFVVDNETGETVNISNSSSTREMYPQISPDGKTIAFFSDKSGEYQIYTQSLNGGSWNQLTTTLDKTNYHLSWSPDGKKILFGNREFAIFYIDVDSKKIVKVDESNQMKNDEFYWEVSDYSWSPDSKWICYSFVQFNRNNKIFLYSLDKNEKYAITDEFFDNLNPSFDANGKYLYYLSSRNFEVTMDFYEDNHIISNPQQVMVVQLRAGETPPFGDAVADTKTTENESFRIDLEGIQKRIYPLPVEPGNFFFLKAGKNKVAWCSVDKFTESEYEEIFKPGGDTKWTLNIFDMNEKSKTVANDKIKDFSTSTNKEYLAIRKEGDVFTTSFDQLFKSKATGAKVNSSKMSYAVDYRNEWNQIFNDTWRWYRDFFYDKGMHGQNWNALGDKYRAYITDISSRDELNWVMQQLVGELSVSHTYISGGDIGSAPASNSTFTGWLGADLAKDKNSQYYKFAKIFGPTEYNYSINAPLSRPDIELKEGDFLIAIDGKEIKYPEDYNKYLQVTSGKKVSVTVNNKPSFEGAKTYKIEPIRNNSQLRYFRWITDNIKKVEKASNGKLGYMHINAMGSAGVAEFDKYWRAFRYRDGIIIDVRRNGGGWTEYFLIDKLERKMTAKNVLNGMEPFRYPGSAGNLNYVAVSNEYNGSDGEAFIEDFKANKLGKVVGVPSWGGLVGILNGQTTIDNGKVEQSNNAFFGSDGKWLVENHGADPDFVVDNDPASVMAGHDAQLEKAIELLLKNAKDNPFVFPETPKYPKR